MLVADSMLGKLARYLRMLGHNVTYIPSDRDDSSIIEEYRDYIILTRDKNLNGRAPNSILIKSYMPIDQLREVFPKLPPPEHGPWELCPFCSSELERVAEKTNLPEYVSRIAKEIFVCRKCGRYYWKGTQSTNFAKMMEGIGIEIQ